jgi:tRNA-dihydrouridine synthase
MNSIHRENRILPSPQEHRHLIEILPLDRPVLILAPMQDITDLPFWQLIHRYGDPDIYYTEYFRVHRDSRPERYILKSIIENPSRQPIQAQMIGVDIPSLVRTAQQLQKYNVQGIDLNLGCPAPVVCSKNAGGALLRSRETVDAILAALRGSIQKTFTVKTRLGFETPDEFDALLNVFSKHPIDALTVHGRTVRELYKPHVHYDRIHQAVKQLPFPVFANGNVRSVKSAREIYEMTGARGLMIGRGAVRNPWIFRQIREDFEGRPVFQPTLRDLRRYIGDLFDAIGFPGFKPISHVSKMKKYLNFIAPGIAPDDLFLQEVRRVLTEKDFFEVCDRHLDHDIPYDPERITPPLSHFE